MVDDKVGRDLRDVAAEAAAEAFDEWLFRMHGVTSSCRHEVEGRAIADAVLAAVEPLISAEAWEEGRAAGWDACWDAYVSARRAASTGEGERPRCWRSECRNTCYYPDVCSVRPPAPPPLGEVECCASGACEVCQPGRGWSDR